MRRGVRTFDEAEFAVVTEIDELPDLGLCQFVGIGVNLAARGLPAELAHAAIALDEAVGAPVERAAFIELLLILLTLTLTGAAFVLDRSRVPVGVALIALAAAVATLVILAVGGHPRASQAQQVQQIAAGLHCPICKDLSVADSPAPLAQQMRQEIAQKLRAGESADQIRASFVAAYGDSVLMSPPRQGVPGTVYYLPLLVLATGVITAFTLLRRWLRAPQTDPPGAGSPELSATGRRAVAKAVARLREEEPG